MTSAAAPRPLIAISLKMYLDLPQTLTWAEDVAEVVRRARADGGFTGRIALFPDFVSLTGVAERTAGAHIELGAQDVAWADAGPFTGEVSPVVLRQVGVRYVEVGHVERREVLGETDTMVAAKVAAAARNGLTPLLCVGEREREEPSAAAATCLAQLERALSALDSPVPELVLAYEPVWAIGAEQPASPDYVARVCALLREATATHPLLETTTIIYGGSAGPGLLSSLGSAVDGLFLGRFAHDAGAVQQILAE